MKIVYSSKMVAPEQGRVSPSAAKPALVVDDWRKAGIPLDVREPDPISVADLRLAHDDEYIDGVMSLRFTNGFGTRSAALRDSLLYTTGAMLTAAKWALADKTAVVAPVSGFHHATWWGGGGFCTFNGLMATALVVQREGLARKIGILDCDNHYGNGTDDILEHLENPSNIVHRTAGAHFENPDQVPDFFKWLEESLDEMETCDLVLYQAGADPHINDLLGGWMTSDQMRVRDALVFQRLRDARIPLVWNLAGGYQRDESGGIAPVLELHRATAFKHQQIFT